MEAQEFKITFNDGSVKAVKTTAFVFYDEDGEAQSLPAANVRTVIRADASDLQKPRVRAAAI